MAPAPTWEAQMQLLGPAWPSPGCRHEGAGRWTIVLSCSVTLLFKQILRWAEVTTDECSDALVPF